MSTLSKWAFCVLISFGLGFVPTQAQDHEQTQTGRTQSGTAQNKSSTETKPVLMKFGWPTSGKVRVTETVLKNGKTAEMAYDLVIKKDAQNNLIISYENFKFLSLAGMDFRNKELPKQLLPVVALMSAVPGYKVSPKGELLAVIGMQDMLTKMMSNDLFKSKVDEATKLKMQAMFKNPMMLQTLETKSASNWNAWVGTWVGFENDVGAYYKVETENVAFGKQIPFNMEIEQLPLPKGTPKGMVKMNMISTADNEAVIAAVTSMFENIVQPTGVDMKGFDPKSIKAAEQRSSVDVITNPLTLMPSTVIVEQKIKLIIDGMPARNRLERHQYDFDWSK